ncbi:MAG: phosphogluconate dehydrogenase (NAD(+)-dependent, decarboxylating) [Longimicrobiales bacterium]
MDVGMVGLGRMGGNMAERLVRGGHHVVGWDHDPAAIAAAGATGVEPESSLEALVGALVPPRAVWLMVPAGAPVDATLDALVPLLARGDVVVDGGNTNYHDTVRRSQALDAHGIYLIDSGTSGGIWGLEEGYSLMIGGADEAVTRLTPLFEKLAPAPDRGWGHVGGSGSGHFVKMVHNGIEYGLMQAYAEGFAIMEAKTEYELDLQRIAEIWRYGSVVRSWLLDLAASALSKNARLEGVVPYVEDSGEGRWTVAEAIDLDVPAPVVTLALLARLRSRVEDSFADRLLAVLREEFGGHAVRREDAP